MPKFRVTGLMTISVSAVVEAKDKKAAIKKAGECPVMNLCWQCAEGTRGHEDEWRTSGELDGTPDDLTVAEE